MTLTPARKVWDVIEPIASQIYFAPEAHRAYEAIGFDGPSRVAGGVEYPNMLAYFVSRGACLGDQVSGHMVAAAFGVFKRPMVVAAVEEGWKRADAAHDPVGARGGGRRRAPEDAR